MQAAFRPLTTYERTLLERLLEPDFPGRDALRGQLDVVTAKPVLEDGTLALQCGPCLPAAVKRRIPTEGACADADGGLITVLLHVVDGRMHELEIFKTGPSAGSKIINPPEPANLELFTPYGEAGVRWGAEEAERGGG
ncbi:MAG: hypothetical protein ABSC93_04900 [Bryobacteraceae bacterium]|jgi:hypothetical protein